MKNFLRKFTAISYLFAIFGAIYALAPLVTYSLLVFVAAVPNPMDWHWALRAVLATVTAVWSCLYVAAVLDPELQLSISDAYEEFVVRKEDEG